ncbi:MAG: hypothetical protein BWY61_00727 [Firmicutes bacterium ADurb.Bin354]|nr:MAG: hypothetical protein BWY61_00727 [Firmicutes bacterium ADurb.Bin354]
MSDIYEVIYDTISENMIDAGSQYPYNKETFLNDIGTGTQEVDVSRFLDLPNDKFYQAIFVATMRRLPNTKAELSFEQRYSEPKEEFQTEVLRFLDRSSFVAVNNIRFINNPYFEQKRGLRYKLIGLSYGLKDKSELRQFGKKLPQPVQKVIRRIFL